MKGGLLFFRQAVYNRYIVKARKRVKKWIEIHNVGVAVGKNIRNVI